MPNFDQMQQQDTREAIERVDDILSSLTGVGPTGDIVGYTYRADNHRPDALVEALIREGRLAPGARGMDPDEALDQLAAIEGVNRQDEYTFDSDEFPKVILFVNITEDDEEWLSR